MQHSPRALVQSITSLHMKPVLTFSVAGGFHRSFGYGMPFGYRDINGRVAQSYKEVLPIMNNSICHQRRTFISLFTKKDHKILLDETVYDKQNVHFTGKIFGFRTESVVYYAKLLVGSLAVVLLLYVFVKGAVNMSGFSLYSVARIGFFSGFCTCGILYFLALTVRRRIIISPNAVYNQSISLAMKHPQVKELLGSHPKTGEFKAYCATGGFKLPFLRRVRSGSYDVSDMLGLKPRRLQMIFLLKNDVNGREGLVTVDVKKNKTGAIGSTNVFTSLAVVVTDPSKIGPEDPTTIIIIGTEADMVMRSFTRLR